MRYAWQGRETYLESWSDRPLRRMLARTLLARLRRWDRATSRRVSHFVAISETVRGRITRCYRRDSRVIQPPVDAAFYTPDSTDRSPRDDGYLVVSALVPYKRIDQAVSACTESGRRLTVIGEGPGRARLESIAGPSVQFLGWQPDDVIRNHYRRCRALIFPGEEDFGIVPDRSPRLRGSRDRAGSWRRRRDGGRYRRPHLPPAHYRRAARCNQCLGISGCPHDPILARRRAEAFALAALPAATTRFPGRGRHRIPIRVPCRRRAFTWT